MNGQRTEDIRGLRSESTRQSALRKRRQNETAHQSWTPPQKKNPLMDVLAIHW